LRLIRVHQNDKNITLVDRLSLRHANFRNATGLRRLNRNLHLHGFDDQQDVIFLDLGTDRSLDLPYIAHDL